MKPRDISGRILGRPLSSPYAPPANPFRRGLPWIWVAAALWLLWVTVFSDHSFLRIAKLRRDLSLARAGLERAKAETARLDAEHRDPKSRAAHAELILREQHGMAKPGEIVYRFQGGVLDTVVRR